MATPRPLLRAGLWAGVAGLATPPTVTAAALALDELTCWSGAGTNRAALVLHWRAPEPADSPTPAPIADRALAWGFRWNGEASAADLWQAVLATDGRLFALMSAEGAVLGVGFDLNQNTRFGVRHGTNALSPAAFTNGLATVAAADADLFAALEPGDLYWGGWTGARWRAWREAGGAGGFPHAPAAGQWAAVNNALAASPLADGAWLALAVDATQTSRPPGPPAAAPPRVSPFAAAVVAAQGPFGAPPYDDPASVLGRPTTWFYDPLSAWSGGAAVRRVKLVEAAHHLDPEQTGKLLTTLGDGSALVVAFDRPITNHPAHPYGVDLLVFGNAFYPSSGPVNDATDMNTLLLSGNPFEEPVKISVSPGYTGRPGEVADAPDTWPWYRYDRGPFADTAFPTHTFEWARAAACWTDVPTDFTKPVNPALATRLAGDGLTAADAIDLYCGSGGGTGIDLAESGFAAVRYVKLEGIAPDWTGGELDALAAVRPTVLGETLVVAPENLTHGTATILFQEPAAPDTTAVRLAFSAVSDLARVMATHATASADLAMLPGTLVVAVAINIAPALGSNDVVFAADVGLALGERYRGNGADLDLFLGDGGLWTRRPFAFDPLANGVVVTNLTRAGTLAVVRVNRPALTLLADGASRSLRFTPVSGWTHTLERTTDFSAWTAIASLTATNSEPATLSDPSPPTQQAFYRLRLTRPDL